MQLRRAQVRDFRSIFTDERAEDFVVDLAPGMNTLVGRNNCGKSNVARAIALALDPMLPFNPATDVPGPRSFTHPVVTLRFDASGGSPEEQALLAAAAAYEHAVAPSGPWNAELSVVVLEVSFPPREEGGHARVEHLLTPSGARPSTPQHDELLNKALLRLRETVRFVMISSGESIQSVLEGNFREILHNVIQERMQVHFEKAEHAREEYISGLQDHLLEPLRERLVGIVHDLFPEIDGVTLSPEVGRIDTALSNVSVSLRDAVDTPLTLKGTGVRGGVLVAMLRYLADNATRGMVFALEEPEAFLHPAAQEDLRDELEQLAARDDVSLLVTTHSPFVVSRSKHGRVFALGKDRRGRTRVLASALGNEPHAPLIGDLFRDITFEELLRQSTEFPAGTKAVLLVEGYGDKAYLELACRRAARPELLEGLHIEPAGGCSQIITKAVIAREAAGERPVGVLVDNDEFGKKTRKELSEKFGFQNRKQVFSYALAFEASAADFPWEAEDLFPPEVVEAFIAEQGSTCIDGSKKRPDGAFHYDFNESLKERLHDHFDYALLPHHCARWVALVELIREALEIGIPEAAPSVPAEPTASATDLRGRGGRVLVIADRAAYSSYEIAQAIMLDDDRRLEADVSHVAFYVDGVVKREVPAIRAQYSGLRLHPATVARLRSTEDDNDARAADLVERWLAEGEVNEGAVRELLLLASSDASDTVMLNHEVKNTKVTSSGKPMAWVVGQRVFDLNALAQNPLTTDAIELLERAVT